jgi:hypothetical protein
MLALQVQGFLMEIVVSLALLYHEKGLESSTINGCGLFSSPYIVHTIVRRAIKPGHLRRKRLIRVFLNEASAIKLMVPLLMEQDRNGESGARCFDMDPCYQNINIKEKGHSCRLSHLICQHKHRIDS